MRRSRSISADILNVIAGVSPRFAEASPTRAKARDYVKSTKTTIFLLLLLCLTSCRQYMADQPRYKPYQESGFFPDGTSARPLPEGVIPQGFERNLTVESSATFPFPLT